MSCRNWDVLNEIYSKCLMQNICVLRCRALQCCGPVTAKGDLSMAVGIPWMWVCVHLSVAHVPSVAVPGAKDRTGTLSRGSCHSHAPPALLQLQGRWVVKANPSRKRDSGAAVVHFLPSVSCFARSLLLYLVYAAWSTRSALSGQAWLHQVLVWE